MLAYITPVVSDLAYQHIAGEKDQVLVPGEFQHALTVSRTPQINQLMTAPLHAKVLEPVLARGKRVPEQLETEIIHFDFDQDEITTGEQVKLKRFIERLEKSALIHIRLEGHTDALGSPDYNQRLSLKRAQAVYDRLVEQGIPAEKITVLGLGESFPLNRNATPEHRAANRRTELMPLIGDRND